jgi:hypothetical protein
MSVIVITTPDAENKEDANLILRNNLALNVVLRTGCGILTSVELAITMGAKDLLASPGFSSPRIAITTATQLQELIAPSTIAAGLQSNLFLSVQYCTPFYTASISHIL